jgi:TonB family protein
MKQIAIILFLVLTVPIGCKNKNDSKIKSSAPGQKTNIADTGTIKKNAQDNYLIDYTSNQDNGPVYMYCEKMPEFPGGETAFNDYIKNNVKYPQVAISDKKEGRVVIKFIVRASGEISDVQLIRGIRSDMDDECLRVVRVMPKWKPGMINNKPVAVSFSIPVRFLLKKTENLNGIYILPANNNSAPESKNLP